MMIPAIAAPADISQEMENRSTGLKAPSETLYSTQKSLEFVKKKWENG
jgi:hypothetical protein